MKRNYSYNFIYITLLSCMACFFCACDGSKAAEKPDGLRIAALAPHLAEVAYSLGLTDNIVAVGRYCRKADGLDVPAVSDALSVNIEALAASGADIVFHNSREEFFEPLKKIRPDVKVLKLTNATLEELYDSIAEMGSLCGKADRADELIARMKARLERVQKQVEGQKRPKVMYIEGFAPLATVGGGWITHELIEIAGGENVAATGGFSGWVSMNLETIAKLSPEILICHVRPGPQGRREMEQLAEKLKKLTGNDNLIFYASDDDSLSIPGPNITETAEKFAEMIHGKPSPQQADTDAASENAENSANPTTGAGK